MAIRMIRTDEDPLLRKRSREITVFDDRLAELAGDMIETMNDADGIGIAAPQVGVLKRVVIVMDPSEEDPIPIVLVNPRILESDGSQCKEEGCLSVPNRQGTVERPERIKLEYRDVDGEQCITEIEGDMVRVVCHEVDHLDGILFTDKLVEETTGRRRGEEA